MYINKSTFLDNRCFLFLYIRSCVLICNLEDDDVKYDSNKNGKKEKKPEFNVGEKPLTPCFILKYSFLSEINTDPSHPLKEDNTNANDERKGENGCKVTVLLCSACLVPHIEQLPEPDDGDVQDVVASTGLG